MAGKDKGYEPISPEDAQKYKEFFERAVSKQARQMAYAKARTEAYKELAGKYHPEFRALVEKHALVFEKKMYEDLLTKYVVKKEGKRR